MQQLPLPIILPPPQPAFLPEPGEKVRVAEIAEWDIWPDHVVGEIVIVGRETERSNATCDMRPDDGDWLLLVDMSDDYKRTLCRVEPVET